MRGIVIATINRDRFESYIQPEPNSGCYLWSGSVQSRGYGYFQIGSRTTGDREQHLAHRIAWLLSGRLLPTGANVLHSCDTRVCVNVNHLFLGTTDDNQKDMAAKYRGRKSTAGLPYGAAVASGGKFQARVTYNYRRHYLGVFSTAEEASARAIAFKEARLLEFQRERDKRKDDA